MTALLLPIAGAISIIWKLTMPSFSQLYPRSMIVRMTELLAPYSNTYSAIRVLNKSMPVHSSSMEVRYIVQPGIIIIHDYLYFQLSPLQRSAFTGSIRDTFSFRLGRQTSKTFMRRLMAR